MSEIRPGALRLVSITPGDRSPAETLALAQAGLAGGVTAILLRERSCSPSALRALACDLAALCQATGALLLISNDVALARHCGAHGVHLGHGGPTVAQARQQAPELIVGRSAHWPMGDDDRAADFVTLSPVASTPRSLPRPLLTAAQLSAAVADPALGPIVALGGLDVQTIGQLEQGIAGVAVIRALADAADPGAAARQLLQAFLDRPGLHSGETS